MSLPQQAPEQKFEGWVILEQLGHKRLGGYIREETIAGQGFLRIEIPDEGDKIQATQYIHPATVYAITPTTEAMARAVALRNKPTPVQRWELPAPDEHQHKTSGPAREFWGSEEEE